MSMDDTQGAQYPDLMLLLIPTVMRDRSRDGGSALILWCYIVRLALISSQTSAEILLSEGHYGFPKIPAPYTSSGLSLGTGIGFPKALRSQSVAGNKRLFEA